MINIIIGISQQNSLINAVINQSLAPTFLADAVVGDDVKLAVQLLEYITAIDVIHNGLCGEDVLPKRAMLVLGMLRWMKMTMRV